MEGDVSTILPRPTLPPPSPSDPTHLHNAPSSNTTNTNNDNARSNSVHRYASRDLRTREAQAEIEKWDAWHACAGLSRTEAKRRYISTLIETMKEYASGTSESRELVSELEFVWSQISSQSGSGDGGSGSNPGSGGRASGSGVGGEDDDSPRRAGLKPMDSYASIPPGRGSRERRSRQERQSSDPNRLRVLSPVSQRESEDVVEEDGLSPSRARGVDDASTFRSHVQNQLMHLRLEITALREQLSQSHLLGAPSYSPYAYHHLTLKWKVVYRVWDGLKYLLWASVRQVAINFVLLAMVIAWGRVRGDRRAEKWARERWKEGRGWGAGLLRWFREEVAWGLKVGRLRVGQ